MNIYHFNPSRSFLPSHHLFVGFPLRIHKVIPHHSGTELFVLWAISSWSYKVVICSGSQTLSAVIQCYVPDHNLCSAPRDQWDSWTVCLHSVSEKWKISAIYVHRHNGQYRWEKVCAILLSLSLSGSFFFCISLFISCCKFFKSRCQHSHLKTWKWPDCRWIFQWVIFVLFDRPSVFHWIQKNSEEFMKPNSFIMDCLKHG